MIINTTKDSFHANDITNRVSGLQSQAYVAATAQGWHRQAFEDVHQRLAYERGFPCVFSKNAIRKGLLKFIFVEGDSQDDMQHLADGLLTFVEICTDWNGDSQRGCPASC